MSTGFENFADSRFLGWLKVDGVYHWGIELEGEPHVAVHVFKTPTGFFWGDDGLDTLDLAAEKPYVLMFYGSDNSSFFMRFAALEEATKWYDDHDLVHYDEPGLLFYNS